MSANVSRTWSSSNFWFVLAPEVEPDDRKFPKMIQYSDRASDIQMLLGWRSAATGKLCRMFAQVITLYPEAERFRVPAY